MTEYIIKYDEESTIIKNDLVTFSAKSIDDAPLEIGGKIYTDYLRFELRAPMNIEDFSTIKRILYKTYRDIADRIKSKNVQHVAVELDALNKYNVYDDDTFAVALSIQTREDGTGETCLVFYSNLMPEGME